MLVILAYFENLTGKRVHRTCQLLLSPANRTSPVPGRHMYGFDAYQELRSVFGVYGFSLRRLAPKGTLPDLSHFRTRGSDVSGRLRLSHTEDA